MSVCPKCGADKVDGVECPVCGIVYDKYEKKIEQQGLEKKRELNKKKEAEQKALVNSSKEKKKRIFVPVIIVVLILILMAGGGGFVFMKKEHEIKKFNSDFNKTAEDIVKMADISDQIIRDIQSEWHDAIFSDNKRDFNIAIRNVHRERAEDIGFVAAMSDIIGGRFKSMNPPANRIKDFENLKRIYFLTEKYVDMAVYPTGSLNSYTDSMNKLRPDIKASVREIELMTH